MQRADTLPLVIGNDTPSLAAELTARGIPTIHKAEVRRIKTKFVKSIAAPPVLRQAFAILTNGYLTLAAIACLAMLSFAKWNANPEGFGLDALIPAIAASLVAASWIAQYFGSDIRWDLRDWGAHWRTARIRTLDSNELGMSYGFKGNLPLGEVTYIPEGAERFIEEAREIPKTRVSVEYCSYDPFIKVQRGYLWWRETEYVYHW